MSSYQSAFKSEVARLARKETKGALSALRTTVAQQRRDIAELKRVVATLTRRVDRAEKGASRRSATAAPAGDQTAIRFSPRWVKADRERLGLSARDYARLVGVAMLTIYNWEHGRSKPRARQLAQWGAVRKMGKREALKRLDELD